MTKDAQEWSQWFWGPFLSDWLARVQDGENGVFDALDVDGNPDLTSGKTLLAQARTLFTIAHIALASGDPAHVEAARKQAEFVKSFQKAKGLYRCKSMRDGTATGRKDGEIARSYDQTFVVLGFVTWNKVAQSADVSILIEECWGALKTHLTDPDTGLLRNDDSGADTGPAQNPHMHLYEACLQGFRMTNDAIWLERAADLRAVGLQYFMDDNSGSIAEFLTPDLQPLAGGDGQRREVGHQCEWAWLLLEEAELAKTTTPIDPAGRLVTFADDCGFASKGLFEGAVYDAVSSAGDVVENSFLLWPQTEAIKILTTRHRAGDPSAGERAQRLMCLMFERWFVGHTCFVNQLDAEGAVIWDEGLTRLMYHLVIAMSEGARAGLWADMPKAQG
ncbi:AGE family epimerase/isomerase [Octadecabacter sp. 1_MG-2023]|uniref:AGE family epimerase/isomerase n=1 Tax=unclassified Octadecabacter TaxID=196158 RepID=UPI001C088132|nr:MULTISPECIES: AGE family epimerase/isomerase [unclassified Octadecabacter]MBU2991895.1 AGE family epimerase/isomerase [Octadecabacter sp. B2R22]MDO6735869.1 AGE family epimerase/isomerase [Octadecabacter sp. 1_MG-2023]